VDGVGGFPAAIVEICSMPSPFWHNLQAGLVNMREGESLPLAATRRWRFFATPSSGDTPQRPVPFFEKNAFGPFWMDKNGEW